MSITGSTKTHFSLSEMSLGSSAQMTTASTYTLSDCDYYETSSELLSPRGCNEISQISRCSSDIHCSADHHILASRSSSVLLDKAAEPSGADRYVLSVKSDTCLSQQSKAISDFVDDALADVLDRELLSEEPNASLDASEVLESILQTDSHPPGVANSVSASSLDASEVDLANFRNSSLDSVRDDAREASVELNEESTPNDEESAPVSSEDPEAIVDTISETKNKIIKNLAQVTREKLFSRPGWLYSSNPDNDLSQGEPAVSDDAASSRAPAHPLHCKSQLTRRRSSRCNGVASILRIDCELQPLNLRLSRLLAEFRAMDLRGKLGLVDPSFHSMATFAEPSRQLPRSEVGIFAEKNRGKVEVKRREETRVRAGSELLNREKRVIVSRLMGRGNAQTSRSCESNYRRASRDSFAEGFQLR